jgi:hypothetical protein
VWGRISHLATAGGAPAGLARTLSNPNPFYLADACIIVAPVIESGGLSVGVTGHALRDLDASAVGQVVRNPGGAESVAAYRCFNSTSEPRD